MVAMQRGGLLLAIEEAVRRMGLPCCMVGGIFSLLRGGWDLQPAAWQWEHQDWESKAEAAS